MLILNSIIREDVRALSGLVAMLHLTLWILERFVDNIVSVINVNFMGCAFM